MEEASYVQETGKKCHLDEGEGGRRNVADHKKGAKKARIEEDKKETEDKKAGKI